MKMEKLVFTLLLASALGGCLVGPDYHRPDVVVPDAYRPLQDDTSLSALDSRWWESFGDPVLNGMVLQAVRHNRDLKVALANSEKAAAAIMRWKRVRHANASRKRMRNRFSAFAIRKTAVRQVFLQAGNWISGEESVA